MRWIARLASGSRLTSLLAVLALAVCAGLQGGCGFHPAGLASMPFERLYIASGDYASFGAEFKRYLESGSKTQLTNRAEEAQAILEILGERREQLILSLSDTGRVAEYLLRYRVSYRLIDKSRQELIPNTEIVLQRDMTYSDTQVLGKENEAELLYRDMKNDAILQLARQLAAARLPS
jgi:LPS-assembly lipoprotein